ncbi:hypothetical protein VLK31_28275 [Variovorax sp. H27-G14]|uniref:hypothetical protein n=1 Tax=Variovorax sp. H27-G14 TaxID=3111914 RepID=UPI0038FC8332
MTETIDRPDTEERLASTPRDKLLIAAALAPKAVGRRLIMLHGEWDGCAKPRRPVEHDIAALAKSLLVTRKPSYVISPERMERHLTLMTMAGCRAEAQREAQGWYTNERLRVVGCLQSLPAARKGLAEAAAAKGMENAEAKALSVLAWWLDSVCPVCNGRRYTTIPGTNRLSNRLCPAHVGCGGLGERQLPHGADGRILEAMIGDFIYRARQQINALEKGFTAVQWNKDKGKVLSPKC